MNTIWDDIKAVFQQPQKLLARLILINVGLYVVANIFRVLLHFTIPGLYDEMATYLCLPASFEQLLYRPYTLVTYFFFHEDFFHILSNMLFLYYFGSIIAEYLGNRRLLALYLSGGLYAGLAYMVAYNLIPQFQGVLNKAILLGASGSVFAIVVAAATKLPNYTFNLILIGPVRIVYIAAFYLLLSFFQLPSNPGGNIAHLGGALFGYLFIYYLNRGTDLGKPVMWVFDKLDALFKPKPKLRVTHTSTTPPRRKQTVYSGTKSTVAIHEDNVDETELNRLLDKINQTGYESLTKEEKQRLFQASQK